MNEYFAGKYSALYITFHCQRLHNTPGGGGGGGGVLGISSDGDDRRIFLGLKFSIPGFFWLRVFFWVA